METRDIFILALFRHGYKARGQTIIHLLRGRRTSSVLIYGYFYNVLPYFGLFPNYQEADLQKSLNTLVGQKYLLRFDNGSYQLSNLGMEQLEQAKDLTDKWHAINGLRFSRGDELFWAHLLFATQVVSELSFQTTDYVPVEGNYFKQHKLKFWLAQQVRSKKSFYHAYYLEISRLIGKFPAEQRGEVVAQLSGHKQIGKTYQQVVTEEDLFLTELGRKNQLHLVLEVVSELSSESLLQSLLTSLDIPFDNQSARKTIELFHQGYSVPQIMEARQLKIGTVVDHLIEEVLVSADFPFYRLIRADLIQDLQTYQQKHQDLRNWSYREVLLEVPETDFVSFRFYQLQQVRVVGGKL